jgi:molecular chaperone GrpE
MAKKDKTPNGPEDEGPESGNAKAQGGDERRDGEEHQSTEPVIRDKRRVDPETGEVRRPPADSGDAADLEHEQVVDTGEGEDQMESVLSDDDLDILSGQATAESLAAERLVDLQRVTAEYANYRKRTEANREVEQERAVMSTVKQLLPVLDDLDRAEKHGDLEGEGPFVAIAAKLRVAVEKLGLTPFGAAGEPFDPNVHEAIFQQPSPGVTVETVADVVESGYVLGSTLVRAAKVVVAVPA